MVGVSSHRSPRCSPLEVASQSAIANGAEQNAHMKHVDELSVHVQAGAAVANCVELQVVSVLCPVHPFF